MVLFIPASNLSNLSSTPTFSEFVLISLVEILLLNFIVSKFSVRKHYLSILFINIVKIAGIALLSAWNLQSFSDPTLFVDIVVFELFIIGFIFSTVVYEHDLNISRNEAQMFAFEVSFISSSVWMLIIYPIFHPIIYPTIYYTTNNGLDVGSSPLNTVSVLSNLQNFMVIIAQNFSQISLFVLLITTSIWYVYKHKKKNTFQEANIKQSSS